MWPDLVSNPGPLTYESGALPTALRGPAPIHRKSCKKIIVEYMYEAICVTCVCRIFEKCALIL